MEERVSFEQQIARNKRQTIGVAALMLLLLFGVVFAVGYALGAPPYFTLVLALLVSGIYVAISWARATHTVLLASQARPADPNVREEKLLMYRVEAMALSAGLPTP